MKGKKLQQNYYCVSILRCFIFIQFFTLIHHFQVEGQTHNWERTNPGGGGAFSTIEAGPPAANGAAQIIAGSDLSGAYYSWNGGQSWDVYGSSRGLTSTHISGIGFHPTDANIFFLAADGGIYKSEDGGGNFTQVISGGYNTDVKVAPSNTDIVYAAYHSAWNVASGQVYKSTDGGDTWSLISNNTLPSGLHLLKLKVHRTDANIVYAISGEGRFAGGPAQAFRSDDGGVNWMDITPSADEVMDIALDPVDDDVVYISSMEEIIGNNGICIAGNKGHLHRSADRGNSWGNGPIADYTGVISIPQDNNQIIRLIDPRCPFEWYADAGTWTSTDYGVTWNKTGDIATWGKGYQASALTIWSYGSSYNGYCKTIGGSLTEPNTLFWTNVQWAFGSFDGGNTFNHLHTNEVGNDTWQSTGFDNVVMLDIDINESDNDEMYITFADIGLFRSTDGGASWQMTNDTDYTGNWDGNGGNTRSVLCDPDRPGKVWASQQGDPFEQAYLITSDQAGAPGSWTANNAGLPQSDFMLGLSIDRNSPTNNRTLYVTASGDVYKSQDDGVTWNEVLANGGLYFTKVDAVNGAKVYAGGADGLYFSENGGTSWTKIYDVFATSNDDRSPYGEQYVGISDIEVDPDVEGKVTISVYGEGVGGVFMLEGGSWSTLYLNPYMRCLSIYRENSQIMYAGSSFAFYQGFYNEQSAGVLMSQDGGSNWMAVNEDMPWHSAVTMDITNSSPPTIFVGSSGSGFQKSEVPITTNTRNISSSQEIKIQPNPFVNEIFIDLNDKDVVEGYVEVLNGLGQTVFRKKGISFPATINLSDLEEGIYFLKIENSDGEAVGIQKIIR